MTEKSLLDEYRIYHKIKGRCLNINDAAYNNYGGRGIKMCERWLESFDNFYEDMGARPSKDYSIDRINNDGDYCPENCKWSTKLEQNNNKRNNIQLTFNGKTQNISQWATELNMNQLLIGKRLRRGWSVEDALTKPLNSHHENLLTYNGKTMNITDWAKYTGISRLTICRRLGLGWSIEEALTLSVNKSKKDKKENNA